MLLTVDGINVNVRDKDGFTALLVACRNGYISIAQALHDAAWRCDPLLVRLPLSRNAAVNHLDRKFRTTPSMYVVRSRAQLDVKMREEKNARRVETVRLFLSAGGDARVTDRRDMSAVDYAAREDCEELLQLLQHGRWG